MGGPISFLSGYHDSRPPLAHWDNCTSRRQEKNPSLSCLVAMIHDHSRLQSSQPFWSHGGLHGDVHGGAPGEVHSGVPPRPQRAASQSKKLRLTRLECWERVALCQRVVCLKAYYFVRVRLRFALLDCWKCFNICQSHPRSSYIAI